MKQDDVVDVTPSWALGGGRIQTEEEHAQRKNQPVNQTDSEVNNESVSCLQICDKSLGCEAKQGRGMESRAGSRPGIVTVKKLLMPHYGAPTFSCRRW